MKILSILFFCIVCFAQIYTPAYSETKKSCPIKHKKLFSKIDANQDKKISFKEFQNFHVKKFSKKDKDNDNFISLSEWNKKCTKKR